MPLLVVTVASDSTLPITPQLAETDRHETGGWDGFDGLGKEPCR